MVGGDVTVKSRMTAEEGITEAMNDDEKVLLDEVGDLPALRRRFLSQCLQNYH
jgi:hypothetical protein